MFLPSKSILEACDFLPVGFLVCLHFINQNVPASTESYERRWVDEFVIQHPSFECLTVWNLLISFNLIPIGAIFMLNPLFKSVHRASNLGHKHSSVKGKSWKLLNGVLISKKRFGRITPMQNNIYFVTSAVQNETVDVPTASSVNGQPQTMRNGDSGTAGDRDSSGVGHRL